MTEQNLHVKPNEVLSFEIEKTRKPYSKPIVQELGDLRSLTLGGSPGTTDSAGGELSEVTIFGLSFGRNINPMFNPDGTLRNLDE